MEIVLLEQVRKLGNVGDVVTVKNGYARNFLIPTGKALRATKGNIDLFEQKKKEIEQANDAKVKEAEALKKKIDGTVGVVIMQAGEDGRLYGSVNAVAIADALTAAGADVDRKQVVLNTPIKYIGVHTVELDLYANVMATVHVNIARSESDAKEASERFARGETVMEGGMNQNVAEEAETPVEANKETEAKEEAVEETSEAAETKEEAAA